MEKTEITKATTMGNFLNYPATQKFLESNLRENKKEFVSNLLALYDSDKNLAECNPQDLMMCAFNATSLNLPLNKNLGYAYVIAYKGVPSFQIGYKGLIQLALRTGQYKYLNTADVREGEIARNKFTGEIKFICENPEAKIVGYVAYLELVNGFTASCYMTDEEVEYHARIYSSSYKYDLANKKKTSKWSDPSERIKMAKKTVLKKLLSTYGVLSTEMAQAISSDNDYEPEYSKFRDVTNIEIAPQNESPKLKKIQL